MVFCYIVIALKGNEAAQNRLLAQASRIQENTIFDDDSVQQAQTFLATQGRTETQIQKVIDAAVELSTVTGVDLQTAVMQLDGTFEGNIGKLAKLDSAFKKLTPAQLANGAAADLLIEKYGGTAKAMGDTTAGQAEKLNNQLGELHETVGEQLTPAVSDLIAGLLVLSKSDWSSEGLEKLETAFHRIAQISGDFQTLGLGRLWDAAVEPVKEVTDGYTDFEKVQFNVIAATKEQIDAERERVKAIGGSVEAFDKWVADVQSSQITQTFENLNKVLDITEEKYKGLTDISDKYNASARISSDLILDIRNATEQDLEVAFEKFNSTLGVTRKDFDDYIGQVKELKPLQEDLGKSTKNMVGPFDQLNKTLGEINKKMLDYLTLGKDATQLDRQRFELQTKINQIQAEYNYLVGLHTPIARDNTEVTKAQSESISVLGQAALGTLVPMKELPILGNKCNLFHCSNHSHIIKVSSRL